MSSLLVALSLVEKPPVAGGAAGNLESMGGRNDYARDASEMQLISVSAAGQVKPFVRQSESA
jgi:hypothetical protein